MQKAVPLSSLSIAELQTRAADLRKMAETARTLHTRDALLRLAGRYARLAQERIALSDGVVGPIDAWQLPLAVPRDETDAFTD